MAYKLNKQLLFKNEKRNINFKNPSRIIRAKDENRKSFREDETFLTNLENDFTSTFQKYCGLNCQTDEALVQKLKELYVETKSKQKSDV